MRYNIQKVIESLQKFQKENPDETLIEENTLLSLACSTHKVPNIDEHIKRLVLYLEIDEAGDIDKFGDIHLLMKKTEWNIKKTAEIIYAPRPKIYKWIKEGIIDSHVWECGPANETVIDLNELRDNLKKIQDAYNQ